jgi:molybdenum cofactor cytidylyltransferase
LASAYRPQDGKTIVVPVHEGKRGNPVLWDRRYFAAIRNLAGDVGARHLIGENADQVVEVAVDDPGAFIDVDTPEAYRHLIEMPPP